MTSDDPIGADWQPEQYARFAAERKQPFDDLVGLCAPIAGGTLLDYGCGPGPLTVELAEHVGAACAIGVDSSAAMLARTADSASERVRFARGDLATFEPDVPVDLVFSNAALHWTPDHPSVLRRWREQLHPGGQLAVQVPTNLDHPVYRIVTETAQDLAHLFPEGPPRHVVESVLRPEAYAELLHELGATSQRVELRVYLHVLDRSESAVEWIKGTSLLTYREALEALGRYAEFETEVRRRAVAELGDRRPYPFTFKRVLMHARFG